MSLDKPDFSRRMTQLQRGASPEFFPIVINPWTGGPNGQPMQVGQSYNIPIQPCDHIWLPTYFDASIAVNPGQTGINSGGVIFPFQTPGNEYDGASAALGMNPYDVMSGDGAGVIQRAVIFALQFNSTSAPWLVWSLSDGILPISAQPAGTLLAYGAPWSDGTVGQGDFMRSLSGPVQSMSFKLIRQALGLSTGGGGGVASSLQASLVVLMSTLGFSQQTGGGKKLSLSLQGGGGVTPAITDYPQFTGSQSNYSTSGGGYTQTKLNSLDNIALERAGVVDPRRA